MSGSSGMVVAVDEDGTTGHASTIKYFALALEIATGILASVIRSDPADGAVSGLPAVPLCAIVCASAVASWPSGSARRHAAARVCISGCNALRRAGLATAVGECCPGMSAQAALALLSTVLRDDCSDLMRSGSASELLVGTAIELLGGIANAQAFPFSPGAEPAVLRARWYTAAVGALSALPTLEKGEHEAIVHARTLADLVPATPQSAPDRAAAAKAAAYRALLSLSGDSTLEHLGRKLATGTLGSTVSPAALQVGATARASVRLDGTPSQPLASASPELMEELQSAVARAVSMAESSARASVNALTEGSDSSDDDEEEQDAAGRHSARNLAKRSSSAALISKLSGSRGW